MSYETLSMLIFNVSGLLFLILLFFAYFTKSIVFKLKNELFILLLVTNFLRFLADIFWVLCYEYSSSVALLQVAIKISWFTVYLWGILILLYCYVASSNEYSTYKFSDLFKIGIVKIYTVLFVLGLIVYLVVPVGEVGFDSFSITSSISSTFVMGFFSVILYPTYLFLVISRFYMSHKVSKVILITLSLVVISGILELFFQTMNIVLFLRIVQVYILYLYFENPDLYTINQIEISNDLANEARMARTVFLANISNDIKSPMNNIINLSDEILKADEYNQDKIRNDINLINVSGHNLLDVISNTLDISKIEGNNESLNEKEYSLKNILINLCNIISARAKQKNVLFVVNVDQTIPDMLLGDSVKLYQVLLNILSNSVKYTEVGKIVLDVEKELQGNKVLLKFRISDTGCGMEKSMHDKVLSIFSSTEKMDVSEVNKNGLGLVIVKKYVDLMGGNISFESDVNVGTTFYIDISQTVISMAPLGEINVSMDALDKKKLVDCSKYKILIVDDDPLSLKIASRLFGRYSFQIDTCTSGHDCIYNIKNDVKYDLIFIDPVMPEMDGVETLHIVKKLRKEYSVPPVIVFTANAFSSMRKYYLNEGFDDYLSKPINLLDLDTIINKYLSSKS